jgi:hypothetical protein
VKKIQFYHYVNVIYINAHDLLLWDIPEDIFFWSSTKRMGTIESRSVIAHCLADSGTTWKTLARLGTVNTIICKKAQIKKEYTSLRFVKIPILESEYSLRMLKE